MFNESKLQKLLKEFNRLAETYNKYVDCLNEDNLPIYKVNAFNSIKDEILSQWIDRKFILSYAGIYVNSTIDNLQSIEEFRDYNVKIENIKIEF